MVREPDLAVSVIHTNPNFCFFNMGGRTGQKRITNKTCVDSWHAEDRIHERRLFKSKPHFD